MWVLPSVAAVVLSDAMKVLKYWNFMMLPMIGNKYYQIAGTKSEINRNDNQGADNYHFHNLHY